MAFPIANPVVPVSASERFDEIHTLTCNGTDITPNKALASALALSNKYEACLLSADFQGLKLGDQKHFAVRFKTIPMQGELYRHAGKWSSTEDNIIDMAKSPIYRPFTMALDTEYPTLELEIVDKDGTAITGDSNWGSSYFTIHIRHNHELKRNEWLTEIKQANEATALSANAVRQSVDLVKSAVDQQKASQDITKTAIDQCKESVNLVKTSCDSIIVATGQVTSSVNSAKAGIEGACGLVHDAIDEHKVQAEATGIALKASVDSAKAGIEGACGLVHDAIDEHKVQAEATGVALKASCDALAPKLDDIKIQTELVKSATDSVASACASIESVSVANKNFLKASTDANRQSVEAFKAEAKLSADAHRAVSETMSAKIAYRLVR